jgi:hypothetical protein
VAINFNVEVEIVMLNGGSIWNCVSPSVTSTRVSITTEVLNMKIGQNQYCHPILKVLHTSVLDPTAFGLTVINFQFSLMVFQQQHSSKLQLGH